MHDATKPTPETTTLIKAKSFSMQNLPESSKSSSDPLDCAADPQSKVVCQDGAISAIGPSNKKQITVGSLFSGIGGLDLGLERAGMTIRWQVENDPYCQKVLAKHWPNVRRWDDVKTFPPDGDWSCDLICGGFPCQDISFAGNTKTGLEGDRSGLWKEFARIIGLVRPSFVLVENVAALLNRGMGRVLSDLNDIGFDAEWSVVSACSMGAPHTRARVFIVAYPKSVGNEKRMGRIRPERLPVQEEYRRESSASWQLSVARALRISDRSRNRMDKIRLAGPGNAVVPQVAEWIGRRIMEASAHA